MYKAFLDCITNGLRQYETIGDGLGKRHQVPTDKANFNFSKLGKRDSSLKICQSGEHFKLFVKALKLYLPMSSRAISLLPFTGKYILIAFTMAPSSNGLIVQKSHVQAGRYLKVASLLSSRSSNSPIPRFSCSLNILTCLQS